MTCNICLNPKRQTRFKSSRLVLCQWCVSELIKDKEEAPKAIIDSLRLNYEKIEIGKIRPLKNLANSQPTPPIYPDAELQLASSVSLREATHDEGVLTSLYRSLVNDQERKKEAEKIKLRIQQEIIERYEAKKETYRQQLISIEQAKKSYLELKGSIPNKIEEYTNNYIGVLKSTTEQLKSKNDRLLRAYLFGLINAENVTLNRPNEDEYESLRDLIKSQDGHACVICNKASSDSELHVHHIIPLSLFGTNQPQNLVTLCYSCHNTQHSAFKVARAKSDIPSPRKSTFIAVNIKTTGKYHNYDDISEIGAALFENGKVIKNFQSLIHTTRNTSFRSEISRALTPDIVFPKFISFIGKSNLVVHNATSVMPFLHRYAKASGTTIQNYVTDTVSISKKKLPELNSSSIFTLTSHFKIKRKLSDSALDYSIAIGLVFLRLASIKDEASTPQFRESTAKRTGSSKKNVAIISNPEITKPTPITGNETLEDAFKLDSQQDYTTSFQIYRHLARQGEVIAQFNLGVMYANGQGIAQNDKHAVYCYQKAAEQGYAKAQNNFGWMYGKGRGLEQNYKQAVFWYRKAADQGNAIAQSNLGVMYQNGSGVATDDEQAVFWYRKAAEQDYANAQNNLGWMYQNGRGIEQNDEQAVFWYLKAAEQGSADAQKILTKRGINWKCA